MSRRIRLFDHAAVDPPAQDTALSHAILAGVADGSEPETLRLFRPGHVVAFGRQDTAHPGYPTAIAAARTAGFAPIERLAGGRAAVFHPGTIAFAWAIPTADPRHGVTERFEDIAAIMVEAFAALGLDARIGEVPGEYCAGRYSVNLAGRHKVMGVGQRLVAGAAHVGGVVVVDDADAVNRVLEPIYRALEIAWDPAATGALDGRANGVTWQQAWEAIAAAFGSRYELDAEQIPDRLLERATDFLEAHRPPE